MPVSHDTGIFLRLSPQMQRPTEHLGWLAKGADEGSAHARRIAKTAFTRHAVDAVGAGLKHQTSRLKAQVLDGLGRGLACFAAKQAAELARAQMGDLGQLLYRQLFALVLLGVGQRALHAVGLWLEFQ